MGQLINVGNPSFRMPILFDPGFDWDLQIENKHPGSASFTSKTGRVTEVARVPWEKSYDAMLTILGFSYSDPATNVLIRNPPLRHPFFTWLFATSITDARGVQFDGQTVYNWPGAINADADYSYFEVNVTFEPLPFTALPNNQAPKLPNGNPDETQRYVSYKYTPKTEFITRSGGSMQFAEGGAPPQGTKFVSDIAAIESKCDLEITWHNVDESYIVPTTGILPTKIFAAQGCINSQTFMGFAAGTLLMLPPRIERYPSPFAATDNWAFFFACDVTFPMVYFDPVLGSTSPYQRGHNNKPWFSSVGNKVNYYYVSNDGNTGAGSYSIYNTYDFNMCFLHC